MNTHESVIRVDDSFTGTTREVIEYLGFGTRAQILGCAHKKRRCKGHKLEMVGILKHVMIYGMFVESKIPGEGLVMVHHGSAEYLADEYKLEKTRFSDAATKGTKVLGAFYVKRIGMSDVMEEL